MLCKTAILDASSAKGIFIENVIANTLMVLRDQLECEKKRFISDLQNANYSHVTAAKLAAQTCI